MCDNWQKPKQGVSLTLSCSCGLFTIRKDSEGSYVPLRQKGRTLQVIGFKTADEAKVFISE